MPILLQEDLERPLPPMYWVRPVSYTHLGLVDGHKQHYNLREILVSFKGAILPLTTPLFILGSIMLGIACLLYTSGS